jgi:threonine dehydratase
MTLPVTPDDIRAAHARIAPFIRRTPILAADEGSLPAPTWFKLELFQHAGSFKARGAFHQLVRRVMQGAGPTRTGKPHVTAASGGNHGVAVALAAKRFDLPARIFVPEISSPVKVAAIRAHGAEVVIGGARYADAQAACDRFAQKSGALLIHPYDALDTIAGAGTVALEWEEDQQRLGLAPVDTVLVAVGGGGLIAGVAAWFAKRARVIGVEPEGSRCLHAALEAGAPVDVTVESLAADSLGARQVGALPFAIARSTVDRVVLVRDESIRAAQQILWKTYRIAAEPGGAAALAALLGGSYVPSKTERIGVLLCGSNVDPATLLAPSAAP